LVVARSIPGFDSRILDRSQSRAGASLILAPCCWKAVEKELVEIGDHRGRYKTVEPKVEPKQPVIPKTENLFSVCESV
jgi:hypothetical protein